MEKSPFRQTKRISYNEGLKLFTGAPLEELQERAHFLRCEKNLADVVTYVLDSNPNYSNLCHTQCSFCAFSKKREGYFKTVSEVMDHLAWAEKKGLTTVLLQGGLTPQLTFDYLLALVKEARARFPTLHPHFFSAPEIDAAAKNSKLTIKEVLKGLFDAGLRTIPGGGAEILSEPVRKKISPKKISSEEWLKIHEIAHETGYRTTATMMFGHIEGPEDILVHLDSLRTLQDKTGGFLSFIPWSYKRENNPLGKLVKKRATAESYFRLLAFSRLYLDNFPHMGASWFSEGKEVGIKALSFGADDFGGTVMEETVHKSAGWVNEADDKEMVAMIEKGGFKAAQRDCFYRIRQ